MLRCRGARQHAPRAAPSSPRSPPCSFKAPCALGDSGTRVPGAHRDAYERGILQRAAPQVERDVHARAPLGQEEHEAAAEEAEHVIQQLLLHRPVKALKRPDFLQERGARARWRACALARVSAERRPSCANSSTGSIAGRGWPGGAAVADGRGINLLQKPIRGLDCAQVRVASCLWPPARTLSSPANPSGSVGLR